MVVRLGRQGVIEISARPEWIFMEGEKISRHAFASYLQARDSGAKSLHGFTVSLLYGVAIDEDPENDGWISAFVRGRWDSLLYRK
jgi:hypothetical protein